MTLTCFKSYDVRGKLDVDLTPDIAFRIGNAFAQTLDAKRVVIGRDVRESSAPLAAAVADGLVTAGVEVLDLGLCGTEEVYFATDYTGADGGLCITASHNPIEYNGIKMVERGAAPMDPFGSFAKVKRLAEHAETYTRAGGHVTARPDIRAAYVQKVLSFIDPAALPALDVVVNAGNGAAGPTFDALADGLAKAGAAVRFHRMHHDPDARFPNGIPNPMLEENRPPTAEQVTQIGADLAVAWDGDFDRCFLFDHTGAFVPGEYVVGLLAEAFLAKSPGCTIVHDPRVVWNTQDIITRNGGQFVLAPTGHAFLKKAMRDSGAAYGGEMSAHHYFKDFMACDSGMIPWLLILELIGRKGVSLSDLLAERRAAFPSSGEINFTVQDASAAIQRVQRAYADRALHIDETDGLSFVFDTWRFNLRRSNTEPLVRLNVESKADHALVEAMTQEISALLQTE